MSNAKIEKVIAIAEAEVGYDRYKDPEKGTKYGRWYEKEVDGPGGYDYGANGVAYCAMFASWVLAQAGVKCAGMPSAYCPAIHKSQNVGKDKLQRGDLVLFDWDNDGTDDHIGIVTGKVAGGYATIEGNTGTGQVLRRTRSLSTICGGVRPNYGSATAKKPATTKKPAANGKLDVDGVWGKATTEALQRKLGTAADGIVSDQWEHYKATNPGLLASSWEWHAKTTEGSPMVAALQRKLGTAADGIMGPKTIKALQRHVGTTADGCIDKPSACVKALQKRLNDGRL